MESIKQSTELVEDETPTLFTGAVSGDTAQEMLVRSILFKLDTRILPILAMLFLCSFLDRTNVGNAKILGLEDDLNITGRQYDIGLAVFYLTYICRYVEPPRPQTS
ncbi:hypothetical protein AFCA_005366 [Aspergillus flavus]|nr:hypothetical protein AFCA_005366 [Aspergillus flavus]